jgi:hypothetical protein
MVLLAEWRDLVTNALHPEEIKMDFTPQQLYEEILSADSSTVITLRLIESA